MPSQAFADGGVCPRPAPGSVVTPPPDLFSSGGVLNVSLNYYTSMDDVGRTLFCFVTPDGMESPTLHANPGDTINIHVTNMVPSAPLGATERVSSDADVCGSPTMTATSVNIHFHGLNVSPKCHGDEVIHTMINSGESFDYKLRIPANEPPGLYWYHPHIHGTSSQNVQGGATGLIEVEGIANIQPAVSGLPERFLILRDEQLGTGLNGGLTGIAQLSVLGCVHQLRDSSVSCLHAGDHPDAERRPGILARRQCGRQHDHGYSGPL